MTMWKQLSLNRAQDLIHPVLEVPYTDRRIIREIEAKFRVEQGSVVDRKSQDHNGVRSVTLTPLSTLTDEWRSFVKDAGPSLIHLLSGKAEQIKGVYSETAAKMMRRMGWQEGKGLGKESEGRLEPVNATGTNGNRSGLGIHRQSKVGAASKPSSLVAIIDEGETHYGYLRELNGVHQLQLVRLDISGKPIGTGELMSVDPSDCRTVLWWDGGVKGIAELTYPHPSGWTFREASANQTLERMTVRALTSMFRLSVYTPPSCETKWLSSLSLESIPWRTIWARLSSPLLTPRDFKNWTRVAHRSILTRNHSPTAPSTACRCCRRALERFSHIGECKVIKQVFALFTAFAYALTGLALDTSAPLIYLGLVSSGGGTEIGPRGQEGVGRGALVHWWLYLQL